MQFDRCLNPKCRNTSGITVDISDPKIIRVRCPICSGTTLYRDDYGNLETAEQRMDRLRRYKTCSNEGCGKRFLTYNQYDNPEHCDDCLRISKAEREERKEIQGNLALIKARNARGNKETTPWRKFHAPGYFAI